MLFVKVAGLYQPDSHAQGTEQIDFFLRFIFLSPIFLSHEFQCLVFEHIGTAMP
jgi:hypothetical protein